MRTISDDTIKSVITNMRTHFGRDVVTRQEVLAYAESGNYVPTKFWKLTSIGRGVHRLSDNIDTSDMEQNVVSPTEIAKAISSLPPVQKPVAVVQKQAEKPQTTHTHRELGDDIVSHFNRDSLIPNINQQYVEWGNYKHLKGILASNQFFTLYITGESGSGKNEMISQACAVIRRPMVRVSITRDTKEEQLIGSKTLVDGNIKYEEGPVVWAAENGAVLLLDEISAGDANELMCLQNVLEGGSFFVKSLNKVITPAKGFCVVATDNTKGRGSDSGRYMGTNILNDAFLERFMMTMEQGYPNAKVEREIFQRVMQKHSKTDDAFVDQLVKWIHVIRKAYADEAIEEQITTRRGCHIINVYCMFTSASQAIDLCINRFDDTTKEAFKILWEKLSDGEQLSGIPDMS